MQSISHRHKGLKCYICGTDYELREGKCCEVHPVRFTDNIGQHVSGEMNIICTDKVMSEGFCKRKRHHELMCKYGNPGNHGLPATGDSHEGTMGHKCAEKSSRSDFSSHDKTAKGICI